MVQEGFAKNRHGHHISLFPSEVCFQDFVVVVAKIGRFDEVEYVICPAASENIHGITGDDFDMICVESWLGKGCQSYAWILLRALSGGDSLIEGKRDIASISAKRRTGDGDFSPYLP